jgi:pimeloyl-ACP methyl ester carboxylesterase
MRLPMQRADDLHAVMETAGLSRPTLVGWSVGGFIVGPYLAKYGRERTAGINLVDAVTVFSPELEFFTLTFGELMPRLRRPTTQAMKLDSSMGPRPGTQLRRMGEPLVPSTVWGKVLFSPSACQQNADEIFLELIEVTSIDADRSRLAIARRAAGYPVSGAFWGVAAFFVGLLGGAIQLTRRRPAPQSEPQRTACYSAGCGNRPLSCQPVRALGPWSFARRRHPLSTPIPT